MSAVSLLVVSRTLLPPVTLTAQMYIPLSRDAASGLIMRVLVYVCPFPLDIVTKSRSLGTGLGPLHVISTESTESALKSRDIVQVSVTLVPAKRGDGRLGVTITLGRGTVKKDE